MPPIIIADATGLLGIHRLATPSRYYDLYEALTDRLEAGSLRFPREVVDELRVINRAEYTAAWASGLGSFKDLWTSEIVYLRQVMTLVSGLGYAEGFDSLDGQDPSIAFVARMCFDLQAQGVEFYVLTTDFGSGPLSPTMDQICASAGWKTISPQDCVTHLSLPI
ncbi:hypothetical protein [Microbacterium sp. GXS0129]|uniref:hypothetical protein n=1 Tax=Microbacterium sp. GXS0129 TaxID=3377836 RepID=UPI00383B42C6